MANERDAKKARLQETYVQIVDLIGEANVKKLLDHGFQVVVGREFNNFVLATARENQRIRDLHAASERDAGRVSARAELIQSDGRFVVLVTSPTCDEVRIGKTVVELLEPVVKDMIAARFEPKALLRPEPILPPENSKGGQA